ncbi:MAG: phage tail tape measure protein [Candidatus Competibacteraceae bacterium]|nr:phage tail tape measure protein [Candidatus Competibacteraceae bacterium]
MATAELGINIVARNQAKSALKGLKSDIAGIQQSLGGMFKVAGGNLISAATIGGVRALKDAVGGVVGAFMDASNASAEFNAQISSIGAVAGASSQELGELKSLALDLGIDPNLKVSAVEAAQAIEMLARNGLKVPQIMDGAAKATVLLANATGADFATAADIGTDAMALFGIEAKDMTKAVDGITSVTNNSKFSINDYRLALAQGGGVAAAVGVEFDDFNTTIASIAPLFGSGSDAGTSFKTFLQRLVPSSKPAIAAMKELGLIVNGQNQFFDESTGQMKSMADVTDILNRATKSLTEEEKIHYLSTIFGTDAMRAAAGIAAKTGDEYKQLQKVMGQTSATDSAAQRMDNLAGDMEIFRSVVESTRLKIGDEFDGAWRKLYQAGSSALSGLAPQLVELAKSFNANVFLPAMTAFANKMTEIVDLVQQAKTLSGGLFAAFGSLTGGDVTIDASGLVTEVKWGDFVGTLDWSTYVLSIEWGDFIAFWNWRDAITILGWGDYVLGIDWDDWLVSLKWGDYVYKLSWDDVLAKFDSWSTYIKALTWNDYVAMLADWSIFISTLSWDAITVMLDWSLYVAELSWDVYVKAVDLSTYLTLLSWSDYVSNFTWDKFVTDVLNWSRFVKVLNWPAFIGELVWSEYLSKFEWPQIEWPGWAKYVGIVNWPIFIPYLVWSQFLPTVTWTEFIPKLSDWAMYIKVLNWPAYLGEFAWTMFIDKLEWPNMEWPGWLAFIEKLQWSMFVPSLGWSQFISSIDLASYVPSFPGWGAFFDSLNPFGGGGGDSYNSGGSIGPNNAYTKEGLAGGTNNWRGGWTWVGEQGPELLNLPKGAQVLSNTDSKKMIGQLAQGTGGPLPSGPGGVFGNLVAQLGFNLTQMQQTWEQTTGFITDALSANTEAVTTAADMQTAAAESTQSAAATNASTLKTAGDLIRVSAQQFAMAATQSGSFVLNGVAHFTDSFQELLSSFGDNLEGALQNVPGLFGASQVTGDQMRMAELGIPQNFADDWLRRLTDEVVNGVDWDNVDIQDAAKRAGIDPNLPADAILELVTKAWNDRSLFADKANLDLFNVDAIQAELMRQQASQAGTANIMALFGVSEDQVTQAGVSAGKQVRAGVTQGLQTSAEGDGTFANSVIGEVTPEQFAPVGITAIDGIVAEINKEENSAKVIDALGAVFSDIKSYGDVFIDASRGILNAIAQGFGESGDIDMVGRLAGAMRKNLELESSINALKNFGERVLEYVFQGYSEAAKEKNWPGATVGEAAAGAADTATGTGNAIGTRNWRGGLSWVGETGPELVALPRGSRIFSPNESMALAGGGGVNVTVNVGTVANDVDIQRLAYQIADIVQRRRQR